MKVNLSYSLTLVLFAWGAGGLQAQEARWVEGLTEPFWDVLLSAPSNGTVRTEFFKEGEFVHKGDVMMELDKRLEELTVTRRKLVVDTLKTDLDGTRTLFNTTKSVSKDDLDKKELDYKVAVVDYDTAEEQLRRRQLFAPLQGYITEWLVRPGEDCKPQEPVARLVDPRRCFFTCHVESKAAYPLQAGQKMALEIEAGNSTVKFQGTISFASPVVDPASGLRKIKVLFDNAEGKIRPGVPGRMLLTPLPNAN